MVSEPYVKIINNAVVIMYISLFYLGLGRWDSRIVLFRKYEEGENKAFKRKHRLSSKESTFQIELGKYYR